MRGRRTGGWPGGVARRRSREVDRMRDRAKRGEKREQRFAVEPAVVAAVGPDAVVGHERQPAVGPAAERGAAAGHTGSEEQHGQS